MRRRGSVELLDGPDRQESTSASRMFRCRPDAVVGAADRVNDETRHDERRS